MDSHGVLEARQHIQNHSAGGDEIFYWGYATRVFPCTNDAGSCEYLDAVYWYVNSSDQKLIERTHADDGQDAHRVHVIHIHSLGSIRRSSRDFRFLQSDKAI